MEDEEELKLLEVRPELEREVDFESVAPALLQNQLLSAAEYGEVSRLARGQQVAAMLDLLPVKEGDVLRRLRLALQEDYDWLANSLEHVTVSAATRQKAEQTRSNSDTTTTSTVSSPSLTARDVASTLSMGREAMSSASSVSSLALPCLASSPGPSLAMPCLDSSPIGSLASPNPSLASPLHSSEFSLSSSHSTTTATSIKRLLEVEAELEDLEEPAIQFVARSRVMRRWQSLAHQLGLTDSVEIIKHRVRASGGDLDEHVGEVLREWKDLRGTEATLGGLVTNLRALGYNDTANRLEDGSYLKRRR